MRPWALFEAPLRGINLIEASAGTGKTYTIGALYLRLVAELGLPVESILVVSYTKAATAELRGRIRKRLVDAREAFVRGESDDDTLRGLLANCPDHTQVSRRINQAVLDFDRAAIYTIHGFCQRALADNAFASGMAFEMDLVPEQSKRLQRLTDEFWAREVQNSAPAFVAYLHQQKVTPDTLLQTAKPYLGKPYLKVCAWGRPHDMGEAVETLEVSRERARHMWVEESEAIRTLLLTTPALNRNKFNAKSLPNWFALLDAFLEGGGWFEQFSKFTSPVIAQGVKKNHDVPLHPFFDLCAALAESHAAVQAANARMLAALRAELLASVNQTLAVEKVRERVRSYDDLLVDLNAALTGSSGEQLAGLLRGRYGAALIDEFQDTDPVQYEIFSRIYRGHEQPVFLVGDPKQAIYSFRGADVYTYLRAHEDVTASFTLVHNWRSTSTLIGALNALFGANERPFMDSRISYYPVDAALRKEPLPEFIDGGQSADAALRLWLLEADASGKPTDKAEATKQATLAVAAEVVRLLNGGADGCVTIGGRGLVGGDIAILVRSHRQGRSLQQALRQRGVPAVTGSQQSVFEGEEAEFLERILAAVLAPANTGYLRAALASPVFGLDALAIDAMAVDGSRLDEEIEYFLELHRLWREQGFTRMFKQLIGRPHLVARMLGRDRGERSVTNLLHLGELLQQEDSARRPGMEGLIKWLSRQRQSGATGREQEAYQLRLESERHLVRIVTVHKSKGLEYPVVFCPYLWKELGGGNGNNETALFHEEGKEGSAVVDFGSGLSDEHRALSRREALAEDMRLMYVALTRAKYRSYVLYGYVKGAENSPLGRLLHPPADPSAMQGEWPAQGYAGLQAVLNGLADSSRGSIEVCPVPADDGEAFRPPATSTDALTAREFRGAIDQVTRVTSFSALSSHVPSVSIADHDEEDVDIVPAAPASPFARFVDFPRGARPGSCLHEIFERLDFATCDNSDITRQVEQSLARFGIDGRWVPVVTRAVFDVLNTPLRADDDLCLRQVPAVRRLVEMEFHYPLAHLDANGLRALLMNSSMSQQSVLAEAIGALDFAQVRGFMQGFIDLVFEAQGRFYVLDYKSNWLGSDKSSYAEAKLPGVIARDSYYLQYLFYTLAVHLYLRQRLVDYDYDQHFGGVFYLFLRGMHPDRGSGYGVYRDRPDRALIEALEAQLIRAETTA